MNYIDMSYDGGSKIDLEYQGIRPRLGQGWAKAGPRFLQTSCSAIKNAKRLCCLWLNKEGEMFYGVDNVEIYTKLVF